MNHKMTREEAKELCIKELIWRTDRYIDDKWTEVLNLAIFNLSKPELVELDIEAVEKVIRELPIDCEDELNLTKYSRSLIAQAIISKFGTNKIVFPDKKQIRYENCKRFMGKDGVIKVTEQNIRYDKEAEIYNQAIDDIKKLNGIE